MRISASNFRLVPVYSSLKDQIHRTCGFACAELLTVTDTAYPKFQLIFNEDKGAVTQAVIRNAVDDQTASLGMLYSITKHEQDIDGDGNNEYIYVFDGGFFLNTTKGHKYLEFTLDGKKYYTEIYWHPGNDPDCNDKWWLEYKHCCDDKNLGLYSVNFKNTVFLGDVFISRDGEIENIVTRQDGFGVETVISADIRPRFSFEIMGGSWLLDSLSFLKNSYDHVTLRRGEGDETWRIRDIEITPVGEASDCYFPIRVSFTKEVLEQTKCCDSVFEHAPLPGNCAGMLAHLSAGYAVCAGTEIEIEAEVSGGSGPHVFVWSNGHIGKTLITTVDDTTTYTVVVIDAFGCVKTASIEIQAVECIGELEVEITGDNAGCANEEKTLTATPSGGSGTYTYLWSTGETTQSIDVTPGSTTTYSVQVTDTISGDVTVVYHTITIPVNNQVLIFQVAINCFMASLNINPCESVEFEWQIETEVEDVFEPAPGINSGPAYTGISGNKYRLKQTCDGCDLYSNVIMANCPMPCIAEIIEIDWNDIDGLNVKYKVTPGTTPVQNIVVSIYETETPNVDDCSQTVNWQLIGNFVVTEMEGFALPPFNDYQPIDLPTCIYAIISVNGGECSGSMYAQITNPEA